jgi:hypothetical protein
LRCGRKEARTSYFAAIYASVRYGEYLGDPAGASTRRHMRREKAIGVVVVSYRL